MKPFSGRMLPDGQRIFNLRFSPARRVVDNAFGIMANRFGCMLTTMNQSKDTITSIVLASCALHNIMRIRYPGVYHGIVDNEDEHHKLVPGQWRQGLNWQDMGELTAGNRDTQMGKKQRLYLKHYYNSPVGPTAWQNDMTYTLL